jgi:hypothetical protein
MKSAQGPLIWSFRPHMKIPAVAATVLLSSSCLLAACTSGASRHVKETLSLCEALRGPDADKGDGEVRYWFNVARADASRKLWSPAGERAVAAALAKATSPEDHACLAHLQEEIRTREVSGW